MAFVRLNKRHVMLCYNLGDRKGIWPVIMLGVGGDNLTGALNVL